MSKLDVIYSDIQSLRGSTVRFWGQEHTLSDEVPEDCVDALEVIDALRKFEVDLFIEDEVENGDGTYDYPLIEFETAEEYLDELEARGGLKEKGSGNSYNWSGRISNDFYYHEYEDMNTGEFYMRIAFHRFGDVRGNYTDEALLQFPNEYSFYEAVGECEKYMDVDGYEVTVSVLRDSLEVFKDGEWVAEISDLEELKDIGA